MEMYPHSPFILFSQSRRPNHTPPMLVIAKTTVPAVLCWLLLFGFGDAVRPAKSSGARHHYDFFIKKVNVTRLCRQKSILTVNGQFPGPTIYAHKGDVVSVKVHNHGDKNMTIHWHGVKQPRNPWSDGPEYITQCPIRPGGSFTYRVILSEEEGTLWWHAHTGFDRATVHGAIVIYPRRGTTFPFPFPLEQKKKKKDVQVVEEMAPITLGEWWRDDDVNQLLEDSMRTGRDVKPSDANTINGHPGDLFFPPRRCSNSFKVRVEQGKTYLLRVINAGLTNDMFFGVAGHRLTVVATDARYTKPFTVDHVMVASGQTMDLLFHANQTDHHQLGRYYMAARTFVTDTAIAFNNSTATAILEYKSAHHHQVIGRRMRPSPPVNLPAVDDMDAATAFTARLRSLASGAHPVDVPARVDERMLVTMAVNLLPCKPNETCSGPNGDRLAASLNNVSFVNPSTIDTLRAYYLNSNSVFNSSGGFPDEPPSVFNFTGPASQQPGPFTARGTKVKVLEYGAVVEVVFQDTAVLGTESHPMHLHGFSFYVVGTGFGNFDEGKDLDTYNLVDPPCQNTVSVPKGGWAAIRFRAANPGVWFMHCHFDRHMVWGMNTVFIVKDGKTSDEKMLRPPPNMPKC